MQYHISILTKNPAPMKSGLGNSKSNFDN